jgi:hypothetical protein
VNAVKDTFVLGMLLAVSFGLATAAAYGTAWYFRRGE